MMRRLAERPGLVFGLVFAWKVLLLVFTAQPVPANDSFFYDGAIVNYLLHGKYVNPSLAQVLPISGNEVFSAYPPLYHLVLFGWMSVCGTNALAAMWLHVLLLGGYMLVVLGTFRRLNVPPICATVAGLFFFSITFHDRPDTLAHLLGALAIYAAVRYLTPTLSHDGGEGVRRASEGVADGKTRCGWSWLTAAFLLLTLCTSLQIGAVYLMWVGLVVVSGAGLKRASFPWLPIMALAAVASGLIALVRFGFPLLWAGFREHAAMTPSFTGLRMPDAAELLKLVRTAPGILLAGAFLAMFVTSGKTKRDELVGSPTALVAITGVISASVLIGAALLVFTANTVHIANYLQPIIVGSFLAMLHAGVSHKRPSRFHIALFLAAAGLVSVRAIGITTWGVACSTDMGYRESVQLVNQQLDRTAPGSTVMLSAAYLYEGARRSDLRWVHADWPGGIGPSEATWGNSLTRLKPAKLIITQFDYYRRYEPVLAHLRAGADLVEIKVHNTAKIPAPDSIKSFQRVIQHVAWAPVVVEFSWKQ